MSVSVQQEDFDIAAEISALTRGQHQVEHCPPGRRADLAHHQGEVERLTAALARLG